jgi:hypothetical protein
MTTRRVILASILLAFAGSSRAAEIHSNGTGGGAWSEAATWHGGAVPGPDDSVVISGDDAVVYDLDCGLSGPRACKELSVDPNGSLAFKTGGRRVLRLAGPIETYGVIKLDAAESADDQFEIHLTGESAEQRQIKLAEAGALVASGRPKLPDDRRNVAIVSELPDAPPPIATLAPALPRPPPAFSSPPIPGMIEAVSRTSLDLRNAHLDAVSVHGKQIDNTGAKPTERLNLAGCLFTRAASVLLETCDTPAVVGNTFRYDGEQVPHNAINLNGCPLAEVRGNTIVGKYYWAVSGSAQLDSTIADNRINGCANGIYWYGSNDMLKGNIIKNCATGIYVTSMTGALEDMTFDNCTQGLSIGGATLQATNLRFENVPAKDGTPIQFAGGSVTLVNCDLKPEQVKTQPGLAAAQVPRVQAMFYCVVSVKGAAPAGGAVAVAGPSAGPTDLSVRNSPAAIGARGLTPLPKSLKPLILKGWSIDGAGNVVAAPAYNVAVTVSAEKPTDPPKTVKSVSATPDAKWYRAKSDDATPTLEVSLP